MRLEIKLVHDLLIEQRHLVKFLMKTGLNSLPGWSEKELQFLMFDPQGSKIIYPILM